jgi:hypothetical protein
MIGRARRGYDAGKKINRTKRLSWITCHRRTVRDYERLRAHHETYVYRTMIIIMTGRLARSTGRRLEPRQATSALAIGG